MLAIGWRSLRRRLPAAQLNRFFCQGKPLTRTRLDLFKDWLQRGDLYLQTLKISSDVDIIGVPARCSEKTMNSELFLNTISSVFTKDNIIVVKNDFTANLGINREMARNFLEQKVLKGIIDPKEEESGKSNPELPRNVDELYLIKNMLIHPEGVGKLVMDPTEEEAAQLEKFYLENPEELKKRLVEYYGVQGHKGEFVQNGVMSSNDVMLAGLSELYMRRVILWNIPLVYLKAKFVEFLEEIKQVRPEDSNQYGSDWLKFTFPDLLISAEDKFLYLVLARIKTPAVLICDSYNVPGLAELKKNELLEDRMKITKVEGFEEFMRVHKSKAVEEQNDEVIIEKMAILDTIRGSTIWAEPCINNPFPYLSESFTQLSKEEQETVQQRYKYHLSRYRAARRKLTE